ncbi:unnamed protein product [Lymnaea stagnalis]|uniref:Uncharacterized protein n=1 Tax=Lymnaea stagnalis TaxID=6523 RepID=A0AAV2H1R7_LYMST
MPRKRPHSTSSGSSVHEVHQIPSTQLDVGQNEREVCTCNQKSKLKQGKHKRPVKTSLTQLNKSTPVSSRKSSTDITLHRLPPVDPKLLEPSTSHDLNENAARSGNCSAQRERNTNGPRPRGRPKKTDSSEYTVIKVPIASILSARSELTSDKSRKRRRKSQLESSKRQSDKSASNSSLVSHSNGSVWSNSSSSCQRRAPRAKNACKKQKKKASAGSSPSSRYRVTPCPTDGACSSRGSHHSRRGSRRSKRRSSPYSVCSGTGVSREYSRDHHRTGNHSHSNASGSRTHCRNRTPGRRHSHEKSRSPIQSSGCSCHGSRHRYHRRARSSSTHRQRRHEERAARHSSDHGAKNARRSSRTQRRHDTDASRSASATRGNEQKSFIDRFSPGWSKSSKTRKNVSKSRSEKERADSSTSRSRNPSKKAKKDNTSSLMCAVM